MMATKPKTKKPPVLDIKRELESVDLRNYDFYNGLTDEEKKAFSPFVLMRYTSNAETRDRDIQEWYIERCNEFVNKNHWDLGKEHPGLMWKLHAATGTGSKFYHQYLPSGKREKTDKFETLLAELNPAMKIKEVKLLASLMNEDDKKELLDGMGFDKKQRKEYE
jgi:hypothetical protein